MPVKRTKQDKPLHISATGKNLGGRPLKLDYNKFKTTAELYISKCEEEKRIPFKIELAYLLNISKDTLTDYSKRPRYSDVIKRLETKTETGLVRYGIESNKPIMSIFLLKALHGYKEESKLDITSNGETLGVVNMPLNPDLKRP